MVTVVFLWVPKDGHHLRASEESGEQSETSEKIQF